MFLYGLVNNTEKSIDVHNRHLRGYYMVEFLSFPYNLQ